MAVYDGTESTEFVFFPYGLKHTIGIKIGINVIRSNSMNTVAAVRRIALYVKVVIGRTARITLERKSRAVDSKETVLSLWMKFIQRRIESVKNRLNTFRFQFGPLLDKSLRRRA